MVGPRAKESGGRLKAEKLAQLPDWAAPIAAVAIGIMAIVRAEAGDLPGRDVSASAWTDALFGSANSLVDSSSAELRGGYYATFLGPERGASAINAELVAPKFVSIPWLPDVLTPRLHAGVTDSVSGKTSYGYVGALWRLNYTERLFGEITIGGAIHNGIISTRDETGRASFGCRELYHLGANFGYRIDQNWSALITFEHLSNGNHVLSNCPRNEGLNLLGFRIGRSF
jgi:hypothetical protein